MTRQAGHFLNSMLFLRTYPANGRSLNYHIVVFKDSSFLGGQSNRKREVIVRKENCQKKLALRLSSANGNYVELHKL